jgi:Peptidase M50B-like
MQRFYQILLIVSFIAFSWLGFMVVHEFGHALTAWLTGGSVAIMVLHPLQISWTTLSPNPHPQLVAWGGAFWGSLLPAVFLLMARLFRSPGIYLFQFFAGFCLIANGLYLLVDSFGRGGDGGTLIHGGASQWELVLFGIIAAPLGFWLWHGLGPHFGLGAARGRVNGWAVTVSVGLLVVTVLMELRFFPFHKQ